MKNRVIPPVIGFLILALTGCTPVKFYSNEGLTVSTGLKYYTVKPYLMVERDQGNNRILKTTVIYLPDLANPQYMVIRNGPGSKKVDLKLNDGSINSFGLSSDTEMHESIAALSGLISKGSDALKDINGLKGTPPYVTGASVSMELYEVIMGAEGTSVKRLEIK